MMNATQVNLCSRSPVDLPSVKDSATYKSQSALTPTETVMDTTALVEVLWAELQAAIALRARYAIGTKITSLSARAVITRIATEVQRICGKSDRIASSGLVSSWQLTLARHRLQKCLEYYKLGSRQGRSELHSNLSVMIYRHITNNGSQLGFNARYNLIEDFLQSFYVETLKAFRRENQLPEDYTPRTRLELAEYMTFTEHYAKRRINLPRGITQRLIILRAQNFARRQPPEMSLDIEMAVESSKGEEAEIHSRNPAIAQVREKMVAAAVDPSEGVLRDRVISELVQYLESQKQFDCIDYLNLKLQDFPASEIDRTLGISPRQRDYLQQRFKYHVEKFSCSHQWQLVHQWLGADIEQNLGMTTANWSNFVEKLSPEQQQILQLKQSGVSEAEIASSLQCKPKQVQKHWQKILQLASLARNQR